MDPGEVPEVLARDGNVAVIRLPGRRFPGVFVQGDTLATLWQLLGGIREWDRAPDEISELREYLDSLRSYYEDILREQGIPRPY